MVRCLNMLLPVVLGLGFICTASPARPTLAAPSSRVAKDPGPITKEKAITRLKRIPIVKAAIGQAEAIVGRKSCVFDFEELRDLTQFESGSAFRYKVRITCEAKTREFETAAIIEIEGQNLNYGEPLQGIDRLSFNVAG